MSITAKEIKDHVSECEDRKSNYVRLARAWEDMYRLRWIDDSARRTAKQKGQEVVTLPVPFNVVQLAGRLIATTPRIDVPVAPGETDSDEMAAKRERWLRGLWERLMRQQSNVLADMTFYALVRGRVAADVRWVRAHLPEKLRERQLPLSVRALDPLCVGVVRGELYTEYAYYKSEQRASSLSQRYKATIERIGKRNRRQGDDLCEVVDYWYTDEDGKVWNGVLIDEEFAIEPYVTDYETVPIIESYGDSTPLDDESMKGLSILHPLTDLWPYQNRLASLLATGLRFTFWPAWAVISEQGIEIPDIDFTPGSITPLPAGSRIEKLVSEVNVPLAQQMMQMMQAFGDMSTFPSVMYGQEPGGVTAGFAVNMLAQQARGRIHMIRSNLESMLEHLNEMALALVEQFAGDDGVTVWAKDERGGGTYHETLRPEDIHGCWDNSVNLVPEILADDVQRITLGLQLVNAGILSPETFRDKFLSTPVPEDEQDRIRVAQAEGAQGPLGLRATLIAVMERYPDDWQARIAGTPLEKELMAGMGQPQQPPPPPPGMMMGPPNGGQPAMGPPGIPPQVAPPGMLGQPMPGQMGLGPGQAPPGMYDAAMTGAPMTPADELDRLLNSGM